MTMTQERPPETRVTGDPFRVEVLDPGTELWLKNGATYPFLGEAWKAGNELLWRWMAPKDFRIMRGDDPIPWAAYSCPSCPDYVAGKLMPSNRGSTGCESGSLASGGDRSHCSCGVCF